MAKKKVERLVVRPNPFWVKPDYAKYREAIWAEHDWKQRRLALFVEMNRIIPDTPVGINPMH